MGTQQQFCLRWNNHQSNMLSVFDDLFQNEALVDVTLACDGLSIKAHKMVLSACSPYFQSLFLDNPCKHPIVILKDIRFSDLKALMDFMYKGEVNVSQEQLSTLLKTAETLKVRGLTEVAGGSELHNSLLAQPNLAQQHQQQTTQSPQLPRSSIPSAPPLPQQTQPPQPAPSSPSPKRKKVRHRHKSDRSSSQSDHDDSDSHELIEPKVEITEDSVDDERLGDHGAKVMRLSSGRTGTGTGSISGVTNDFTTNTSQGVSSSQETNSTTESQGFPGRSGNVVNLNTPPLLFNPPGPPATVQSMAPVQSIGQPPVLQGSSQGRERHVRKWNEATLAEAMEAVRSRRMSIIAACRQYEIPWGTLYRRLSLANIRSAYSRNDQSYSQYLSMIPHLGQPKYLNMASQMTQAQDNNTKTHYIQGQEGISCSTTTTTTTTSTTSSNIGSIGEAPNSSSWQSSPSEHIP